MLITHETTKVEGNLKPARRVQMTIHPAAAAMIIRSLTKQYSDAPTAVLREYTSNAIDSHMRAGQTRPVEVVYPTILNPNLVIRDYGVGMDQDELDNYGQYGLSDKSDSNDENGGFGYGSKSALAMSSQFTVIAVKGGFKNTVVIGITETGGPSLDFMNADPVPTDDPDGVTVKIPTSNGSHYGSSIPDDFFLGWAPGSILVNGELPEFSVSNSTQFQPIDEHGWINRTDREFGNYYKGRAVVGNVLYEINWDRVHGISDGLRRSGFLSKVVLNLPIGSVEIPPNREDLIYSSPTVKAIQVATQGVLVEARADYQKQMDAAPTLLDAWKIHETAVEYGINSDDYNYKGQKFTPVAEKDPMKAMLTAAHLAEHGTSRASGRTTYSLSMNTGRTYDLTQPGRLITQELGSYYFPHYLVLDSGSVSTKPVNIHSTITKTLHDNANIAKGALSWFLEEDSTRKTSNRSYLFTSLKRDEIDPLVLMAFEDRVVDFADVAADNAKWQALMKKEAAARRVNPVKRVAKADSEMTVRYLNPKPYGTSTTYETMLGLLDTSKRYIILQNENGDKFIQHLRASLTTQRNSNRNLNQMVITLVNKGFVFLMVHKREKVEKIEGALQTITFADAVAEVAQSVVDDYTPERARAEQDSKNSDYNWAFQLAPVADQIDNEVTREWVIDTTNAKSGWGSEFLDALQATSKTTGIDHTQYTLSTTTASNIHPAKRYKLLNTRYYSATSDAMLEYVNLMDAKYGDHQPVVQAP